MVFNYLIGNKDDHAKDFALSIGMVIGILLLLMTCSQARVSMVFALHQNNKIEPTKEDLFAVAVREGLKEKDTMYCLKNKKL